MQYKVHVSAVDLGPDRTINEAPYYRICAPSAREAEAECVRMLRIRRPWGPDTEVLLDDATIIAVELEATR